MNIIFIIQFLKKVLNYISVAYIAVFSREAYSIFCLDHS